MKALLIAEKPSLMNEIKEVYKKLGHKDTITFKSFAGHTMELREPQDYKSEWGKWDLSVLPMIPERFGYKPKKDKQAMFKELKSEIQNGDYDYIINACDPGREGQHIFFSFYDSLGVKLPVKRIWHEDLTENELKRALDNLRDENEPALKNMTVASKYRAYFDWLIGLNGTRAVTLVANKKINVGRVMTPVLKILVDRELELRNFVPKDFWEIEADFGKYKGIYFDEANENETKFFEKAKAEAKVKQFGNKGTVVKVEKKKETKYAPGLHSLQELSNEANRTFGYTMAETLKIAQDLYEKKILSYPRTDSPYITEAIAKEFPKYLKSVLSVPELKDKASLVMKDTSVLASVAKNKKYVDNSKVSDHYAIIPTGVSVDLSKLSAKEQNIFSMVCRRFLAIFFPPMVTNKTNIVTESNGHKFNTTGSVLVNMGYMELYTYKGNDNVLPDVNKGEVFDLKGTKLLQKKTTPPQRYNDETLGKAMENAGRFVEDEELSSVLKEAKGLGTPATRGGIVEKLVKLEMIERKGSGKVKSFHAKDFGIEIIQSLNGKDITLPELTATWEQKLSSIEDGTYQPKDFYDEMIVYVKQMMDDFKHTHVSVSRTSDKEVLGKCPKCQANVVEGKNFYLCANYKKSCDFIIGKEMLGAKISKTEVKKLLTGKETKELEFTWKSGKKGKAKLKVNGSILDFVFTNKR
ncbi:DNA topoisomerase (plasmid) [Aneurinibacillus sp. Ricciae_BoGa-3]|uniref:type IA DNA topoisomerase n=1 Tax=Aneurinibacillus sp. Ricciae_BoGa-3 TaxID=3022697 RepID=UPI0023403F20|nr:type IA DNA topoisomerase [Aneurinibacillus sp. Ricciae_BoGa-3]WCK57734.1 DNA topoisomerase [Aneurinibacillus sp. Ricciae_BoGa-3]